MRVLYIAWKDVIKQKWITIGRLCFNNNKYIFCFTRGALEAPECTDLFGNLLNLYSLYVGDILPPLFQNRILNSRRPEFKTFLEWLDLDENYDPLDILALTEGKRNTDSLEIFPLPQVIDNYIHINFFIHGLSHISKWAEGNLTKLHIGQRLLCMHDIQNGVDPSAIMLRTEHPSTLVGFSPRYLAKDFLKLLTYKQSLFDIKIKKINIEAPPAYQILCKMQAECPPDFKIFHDEQFKPIIEDANKYCGHDNCDALCM